MKIISLLTLLVCISANAAVDPMRRDIKLPTQVMVEQQTIAAPLLGASNVILNANSGSTSSTAALIVTAFDGQPDVPRNLTVTPGGTTADVQVGNVIIQGTDFFGQPLLEVFPITDAQSSTTTGIMAFKTVTSIAIPPEKGGKAATWSVGTGSKLGMKRCMDSAGHLVFAALGGVYEGTRPTVAVGASVAKNTAALSTALDGSKDAELFFFQNFNCLP